MDGGGSARSGVVVVEGQGARGHDTSDGRAGYSVRRPIVVVDVLDGLGLMPRAVSVYIYLVLYNKNVIKADPEILVRIGIGECAEVDIGYHNASRSMYSYACPVQFGVVSLPPTSFCLRSASNKM